MGYKISVITPVYNAEKYLETAINSVINQTIGFENIELILVNDNSTDNSGKIIDEYCEKYENIIGIHLPENSGFCGRPRNIGMEASTAPYLVFLDADDEYLPNAFELYYNTITREKSDLVMGSHYWNLDGDMHKINILHECNDTSDVVNINPMLNERNFRITTYHNVASWGKIFDKKLIMDNNIKFLEDTVCEDSNFYYSILLKSKKFTLLPNDQLYIYNVFESGESLIHTHDLEKFNSYLRGVYAILDLFKDITYTKERILFSDMNSLLLIFSNLNIKDKKECVVKLNEFENIIDDEVKMDLKELKLLYLLILKKHYTLAIILSEIYSFLYNNTTIRKIYRKSRS
ncbi:glycosyltransferase family 2 protein [uncultured Methanobrevibacter sp.]|uniref:glycosyltransferase family 2 protein n=1 Tax=uncultured Methanobrevibacter sp. TaxID=253161 RepID=UPI0026154E3D|nr:glycosyltransferase family 2 protein [uncultured Methanobrevibacter sp.]